MTIYNNEKIATRIQEVFYGDKEMYLVEARDLVKHPCDEKDLDDRSAFWRPQFVVKKEKLAKKIAKFYIDDSDDLIDPVSKDSTSSLETGTIDGVSAVDWESCAYKFTGNKDELIKAYKKYSDSGCGFLFKLIRNEDGYEVRNIVKVVSIVGKKKIKIKYVIYVGDIKDSMLTDDNVIDFTDFVYPFEVCDTAKEAKAAARVWHSLAL